MAVVLATTAIGLLVFPAHTFTAIFRQTKLPDVLLLIMIGLCLGPLLGIVTPADFGAVGPVFTTVTLIILLFEGGSGLSLAVLRQSVRGTLSLTLASFLVTMAAVGVVAWQLTDLGPVASFMLGAIVGSTSPAVVVPVVRQLNLQGESRTILFLESGVSDVFRIVLTALLVFLLERTRVARIYGWMFSGFAVPAESRAEAAAPAP